MSMQAIDAIMLRIAAEDAVTEDVVTENGDTEALSRQEELKAKSLLSQSIMLALRRAFTTRGMEFFAFYPWLKRIELGEPAPDDLKQQYIKAANRLIQVTSPVDHRSLSPAIVNMIADSRSDLGLYLNRLSNGVTDDNTTWAKINNIFIPIILAAAQDKGLYLAVRQLGPRKWGVFRRLTAKAEQLERTKDENPEAYAAAVRYKQTLDEISQGIANRIERAGLIPKRRPLAGKMTMLGMDPITGEESVYDTDGDVLTRQEFYDRRTAQNKANALLSKAHNRSTVPVENVRSLSDEEVDALTGPVKMVSITDDKVKQHRLTRIFPVKEKALPIDDPNDPRAIGVKVITAGRFKGCLLDDVVNAAGRMIEGTSYAYDETTGMTRKLPHRIDTSNREPYVTVGTPSDIRVTPDGPTIKANREKLYLRIPSGRAWSELRDAMKSLACNSSANYSKRGCVPSIEWVPLKESHSAGFFFEAKDYSIVSSTVSSMALSTEALNQVQSYYKDLTNAEAATTRTNLGNYTAEAIGGFKTIRKQDGSLGAINLHTPQKQALAWMDANGNKGVCGLDTGVGKTLVSISQMQKMIRDGMADDDATYTKPDGKEVRTNGRFLYVCPKTLKGNLTKEIRGFLSDAGALIDRTDVMSYGEFKNGIKKGMWKRHPWSAEGYVAIFFDEAQEMLTTSRANPTKKAAAALNLWHPHKICLTASPIDNDPMEAYIMAAICNNIPLAPGTDANKNMRKFRERFCENVGGRIIGVKQDPNTKRDLATWVRRNIFFADKVDVDIEAGETPLVGLRQGTEVVQMDPGVEMVYRNVTQNFADALGAMTKMFRDRDVGSGRSSDPTRQAEMMMLAPKMAPVMKLMNDLSNCTSVGLNDIANMLDTGMYTNAKGEQVPIPPVLAKMYANWKKTLNPDDLRVIAARVGNPKLVAARNIVSKRLARSKGSSRSLLFSDDKKLCWLAAREMSNNIGGLHALALDNAIHILQDGQPMAEYVFRLDEDVVRKLAAAPRKTGGPWMTPEETDQYIQDQQGLVRIPLPFKQKSYRRYDGLPALSPENTKFATGDWQTFALSEISANLGIKSLTLLGNSYKFGQNLQAFNTVIHLDRDTWNSEAMKQRTARSWRQKQKSPVTEITLDTVYEDDNNPDHQDSTLDQIRGYYQQMSADLFNAIIKGAQSLALGNEWTGITKQQASMTRLDKKVMELATSPYSSRSAVPGA